MPNISVAMRIGETPVPIPNTMVKTYPAEDTAGATLWESRWPPNFKKKPYPGKGLNRDRMQERDFLHDMAVQSNSEKDRGTRSGPVYLENFIQRDIRRKP